MPVLSTDVASRPAAPRPPRPRVHLPGAWYHNLSLIEALEGCASLIRSGRKSTVFFLNFDCLRQCQDNVVYRQALDSADLVLADGVGVLLASRLYGERMRENLNGTDFSPHLLKAAAANGWKVFLLGGIKGVADNAARRAIRENPGLKIVGARSGYFDDDAWIIDKINRSGADILFVGFGAPRQELWISANRHLLKPALCVGVGGLLDFMSGRIRRAPRIFRRLHLEWLWRVAIEPRRLFRRYFIDGLGFLVKLLMRRAGEKAGR